MKTVKLKELIAILSGFAFKSERFSDSTGMPLVRIRDVVRGRSETFYRGEYDKRYIVNDGDILIGMDGEFNAARWRGGPALLNQRVCKITSKDERLHIHYLFRFLPQALKQIEDRTPFVTVKHLSVKAIEGIEIPLPPLDEQKRIAEVLDKADALRAKRRQAIAKVDTLLQSVFFDMFGDPNSRPAEWDKSTLGAIASELQNGTGKGAEFYGRGAKVANISDLYSSHTFTPRHYSLLDVTPQEIEKYRLNHGDLLFVRSSVKRAGVAACSMYASDEPCLFSSFMIRVRINAGVAAAEYVAFLMRTDAMRQRLIRNSNTATITNISQAGLAAVKMPLPPLGEQRRFVQRLAVACEGMRSMEQSEHRLRELFVSLQQHVLMGRVSGTSDVELRNNRPLAGAR